MGKIADRLALKASAHYEHAKSIVKAVISFAQGGQDDDEAFVTLRDSVDAGLNATPIEQTEELLDAVQTLLAARQDGESLLEGVLRLADDLSASVALSDTQVGTLFSASLLLQAEVPAWELRLPKENAAAFARALKQVDMIEEDATIRFLPRVLNPIEADSLSLADIRRLVVLLAKEDWSGALDVIDSSNKRVGLSLDYVTPEDAQGGLLSSTGVVMGFVITEDDEPFPLASLLSAELAKANDIAGQNDAQGTALSEETFADFALAEASVSKALASAVSATSATLNRPVEGWFEGVATARQVERSTAFKQWATIACIKFADGDKRKLKLAIDTDFVETAGFFPIRLYRLSDDVEVSNFNWYRASRESVLESAAAFKATATLEGFSPPTTDSSSLYDDEFEAPSSTTPRFLH